MKTYRINKNAERFARKIGSTPELLHSFSLVRFSVNNYRCIAAWTPEATRPLYVYKVRTNEEYDRVMKRIQEESEQFYRYDEALKHGNKKFLRSLHVGDIFYTSWDRRDASFNFYQIVAIRGSMVDLRQIDQQTTSKNAVPIPDIFIGQVCTGRITIGNIFFDFRIARKWDGQPLRYHRHR